MLAGIFSHFPQTVGNFFVQILHILHVPIYARQQALYQLSLTVL